jgi:WD40 repeat protein
MIDSLSGGTIRVFQKLPYEIRAVSISNTGQYLAGCDRNQHCAVWDLSSGIKLSEFSWNFSSAIPIYWSSDDSHILAFGAYLGNPAGPNLIDIGTGKTVKRENKSNTFSIIQGINSAAVSSDGKTAITGHSNGSFYLWDVSTGECLKTITEREGTGTFAAISPDKKWAYSGGKYLRIWELSSGRCVRTFPKAEFPFGKIMPSPDGKNIMTLKMTGFENGAKGNLILRILQPGFENFKPAGSISLSKIVTSAESGKAQNEFNSLLKKAERAFTLRDIGKALDLLTRARNIPGYERSPKGLELWTKLYPYTRKTGLRGAWITKTLEGHKKNIFSLSFDKTGTKLVSTGLDNKAALWDVKEGSLISAHFYGDIINKTGINADGSKFIASSNKGTVRIWDSETLALSGILGKSGKSVNDARFSKDGSMVISGGDGAIVNLWNTKTGELIREFQKPPGVVETVDISPDGKWVMLGYNDIQIKSMDEKTTLAMNGFQRDYVKTGCFGSDGGTLFAGVLSSSLYVYNAFYGSIIYQIQGFSKIASDLAVSADNRWIFGGMSNFSLWDMAVGQRYRVLDHNPCGAVAVTPDGRLAASSGGDFKIRLWTLDWELEYPEDRSIDEGAESYLRTYMSGIAKPMNNAEGKPQDSLNSYISLTDLGRFAELLGNAGYGWVRFAGIISRMERILAEDPQRTLPVKSSLLSIIDLYRNGKIKPPSQVEAATPQTEGSPADNLPDIHKAAEEIMIRMKNPVPALKPVKTNIPEINREKTIIERDDLQEKPEEKKSWLSKIFGKFIK